MQPGDTITPGQSPQPTGGAEQNFGYQPEGTEASPAPAVVETPNPSSVESSISQTSEEVLVEWSASEYIDHQKSAQWYLALFLASVLLAGLLYLVTRDWISVVVVLIATGLFGVSGAKKPRTLTYRITNSGVRIADKLYPYEEIKLFSVTREGGVNSIHLLPLRRFMPPLSIYYPPDSEESIFNALANFLPHEESRNDPIDRLMKRLRF